MIKKEFVALGLVFAMCGSLWMGQAGIVCAAGTGAEYEKDENVYGSLSGDGSVKELYVVNQFAVKKAGEITDWGIYDSVTNLTDKNEILSENGKYNFQAKEGNFYYQGNIASGKLPWDIFIQYFLDGKEVRAEELAGAAGKMELHIKTSKNKEVDNIFFENYMMQVSVTLDNEQCSNIKAAGAAIADAGTSRQINFTVMPGKQADIVLKADVKDFEMGGISIAAVPFSMSVDLPDTEDMTSGLLELAEGIQKLNDGVGELDGGISEFADGASGLSSGISEYADGVGEFHDGFQKINKNFGSLVSGAKSLSKGSSSINSGLKKIKKSGKSITDGSSGIAGGLSGLNKKVSSMDLSGLAPADAAYLKQMVAALDTNYGQFNQGLSGYVGGVGKLAKNYSQFHSGISEYSGGVGKMKKGINSLAGGSAKLASGAKELAKGSDKLASGAEDLADGVSELYDGTKEMADGTADMPDEMDKEIDKMMNEYTYDFDLVSFASKENKSVNAVQFTLSTPEISVEEEETVEVKEEKKGFFERLKALF